MSVSWGSIGLIEANSNIKCTIALFKIIEIDYKSVWVYGALLPHEFLCGVNFADSGFTFIKLLLSARFQQYQKTRSEQDHTFGTSTWTEMIAVL